MVLQLARRRATRLVSAAMVVTLVAILITSPALARTVLNTIDSVAIVTDEGRHLVVTGPITCTAGERGYLQVTVTQRTTGAEAEGRTRIACTGDSQQWEVRAATQGIETFQEGPATAVALSRTTTPGQITDAHQWLVEITLIGE